MGIRLSSCKWPDCFHCDRPDCEYTGTIKEDNRYLTRLKLWSKYQHAWDLVVSSVLEQYGIRIYSAEFKGMKWQEFSALISGIGPDTALGRIVAIRAETDKEVIKNFSDDQRRIWREWRNKSAKQKSKEEVQNYLEMFKAAFVRMAGDGGG